MKKIFITSASILALVCFFGSGSFYANAQAISAPAQATTSEASVSGPTVERARVTEILSEKVEQIPATTLTSRTQSLQALVLDGTEKGKTVIVDNDRYEFSKGDVFYLAHADGEYSVSEPYRLPWLYGVAAVFVICVLVFGGKQGARGLVALALSLIFIGYLLFPAILHGISPVWASIGVASLIVILGSYVTHGFNKVTTSAVIGMIATIVLTGLTAMFVIHGAMLSGFETEESLYLNMDTNGAIDFAGLLLGGILIGALGVLYDAAIGQSVAVDELHHVAPHVPRSAIFRRALRIGREHVGALVNTLAIAYVGASLPLLLLFYQSGADFLFTMNKEVFATEIVRILIGSIGLVLAVPLTTIIASYMLVKKNNVDSTLSPVVMAHELKELEDHSHTH